MTADELKALAEAAVSRWLAEDEGDNLRCERLAEDCGPNGRRWIDAAVDEVVRALAAEKEKP